MGGGFCFTGTDGFDPAECVHPVACGIDEGLAPFPLAKGKTGCVLVQAGGATAESTPSQTQGTAQRFHSSSRVQEIPVLCCCKSTSQFSHAGSVSLAAEVLDVALIWKMLGELLRRDCGNLCRDGSHGQSHSRMGHLSVCPSPPLKRIACIDSQHAQGRAGDKCRHTSLEAAATEVATQLRRAEGCSSHPTL